MRQALAVVTTLLGGCSFIYNPDHINRNIDGHVQDAELDAHVTLDADPSMLTLLSIAPATIYEGQGAPNTNSLPVLVVISGHNITDAFNLTVTTTPPNNADIIVGTAQRSHSGDYIVVPIGMKVNGTSDTMNVPLTFTVDEPGAPTQVISGVALQYLPQLDGTAGTGPITIDSTMVAQRYSEIVGGAVTFSNSTKRVVLKSMSKISLGTISAQGVNANKNTAGAGGPGGCAGGMEAGMGGCGLGGGNAASAGNGGGGGGYGSMGLGTTGGAAHGEPQVMSYDGISGTGTDVNQSSGGGGGSLTAGLVSAVGAGGGGGGTVELDAEGDITTGAINANGGSGGDAAGVLGGGGGGGGGGSGGLVVVRSVNGMISSTITGTGGSGGAGAGTGTAGGNGGAGRMRWDSPQSTPLTSTAVTHRAPAFTAVTQIVTTNKPTLTLAGSTNDIVDFYLTDGAGADHNGEMQGQGFVDGAISFQGVVVEGYNHFCAVIHGGMNHVDLDQSCVELVYLPN
jgi:hypothetical protein